MTIKTIEAKAEKKSKKLKREERRKSRLRGKIDPMLGLPADDLPESVNSDDLNLLNETKVPSSAWLGVTADSIGQGFEEVDESIFDVVDNDRVDSMFLKPFKNRFIIGRSPFISYTVKVSIQSKKNRHPKVQPFNANTKVTKGERRKFSEHLGKNIDAWRDLFVHELLPMSLSIQTAAEEVKDKMSQLIDESVGIPADFIKAKTYQAIQLRVVRAIGEKMGLTPEEQKALMPELFVSPSTK